MITKLTYTYNLYLYAYESEYRTWNGIYRYSIKLFSFGLFNLLYIYMQSKAIV